MDRVKVQLGFHNAFAVKCKILRNPNVRVSRAGGLCLLWREDIKVSHSTYSDNHIDVLVGNVSDINRWRFTGQEIKVCLDRFMATQEWTDIFSVSRVTNLKPSKSDHLPILLERCEKRLGRRRGRDPFQTVCLKIEHTRQALWEWSKHKFGNLKAEIERTRAKLAVYFDKSLSAYPEEERDMNTQFFHQRASNRKRRNEMKGLFNNEGVWCTEDTELEKIVLDYFGNLFTTSHPTNMELFTNLFPQVISNEMNMELVKEFEESEVLKALKQMHPLKAPGPDGFSPIFYQCYWSVVGRDVTAAALLHEL
ncbi:uncharacterized protein LOC121052879 [Rosa chinensis]|uniref:uncharacterized protein LOC121052879 n=1 Tax=Rosa chinensis TaxID=74649 RepID=UPI001AD8F2DB|nr:uncharacterized protein LOC121052879 [Rosa chinensis]